MATLLRILLLWVVPLKILLMAIFIGWLNTFPIPEGTLFTMVYPLTKGLLPTVWTGGYKDCPIPPLPEHSEEKMPPPHHTSYVTLPGSSNDTARTIHSKDPTYYKIPQSGIGMCCRYTAYDAESVRRTILWYLVHQGGRHIDTADYYQNHEWIGEALQIAMTRYGIPRRDIWVTTKLWPRHYGTNATLTAIPRMLQELQLDYIDLVLMHAPSHQPIPFLTTTSTSNACGGETRKSRKACRRETWEALTVARNDKGYVRHVGVSNFNIRQLQELQFMRAKQAAAAPIANHQFQYNPWVPDAVHDMFRYCQQHGIPVTAWSSFAGSAMLQHMASSTVDSLRKIAKNHGDHYTVAQILLQWAAQKGAIVISTDDDMTTTTTAVPVSSSSSSSLQLTLQEMAEIEDLKRDESAKSFFVTVVDDT
ncbi:Deoxymugineic acid synthase 1 [Seminavis robusta]|uniref:Deoxymugineic acid synthase 1 n=1 Tax=Seminavis robusta TaxID=568900 RepID=A0A9N8DWX8_9STRA|nr:Deoxymugineic acid synthase 1 [Seminavis robusta]|eukprot:Sro343_g121960.1 Deoxymugineic acid synthase 1 (420) ;mRNA; f:22439-23698